MIESFMINHDKLKPGLYISRIDEVGDSFVTTIDIRVFEPNKTMCVPKSAHTIEHILADYLRNKSGLKESVLYFGPMGCMTGFYLLLKGKWNSKELVAPLKEAFTDCSKATYIPGCSSIECGNYLFHDDDLSYSKNVMKSYVDTLSSISSSQLYYPD